MTRIEAARRRVTGAKRIAAAVAAAGFLVTIGLVRGTHVGHAATSSGSSSFGSSSIAPSTSSPQTQTSVS